MVSGTLDFELQHLRCLLGKLQDKSECTYAIPHVVQGLIFLKKSPLLNSPSIFCF